MQSKRRMVAHRRSLPNVLYTSRGILSARIRHPQTDLQNPPVERIDLLISARWIIPIEPANTVLEDHSLAIHHGRIVAVLPTPEATARYSPVEHIQRPTSVVLPGFVNAHTHAGMTLLRGARKFTFESC